jgi:hypothetical protein
MIMAYQQVGPAQAALLKGKEKVAEATATLNKAEQNLTEAKRQVKTAKDENKKAGEVLQKASDKVIETNWYLHGQTGAPSLDSIVNSVDTKGRDQYQGYSWGKELLSDSNEWGTETARNVDRWRMSRQAVEDLARNPEDADKYKDFRAAKGKCSPGRVFINGNCFW